MFCLGNVTTFAGSISGNSKMDGFRMVANFQALDSLTVKQNGVIYVADGTRIRKISTTGM